MGPVELLGSSITKSLTALGSKKSSLTIRKPRGRNVKKPKLNSPHFKPVSCPFRQKLISLAVNFGSTRSKSFLTSTIFRQVVTGTWSKTTYFWINPLSLLAD